MPYVNSPKNKKTPRYDKWIASLLLLKGKLIYGSLAADPLIAGQRYQQFHRAGVRPAGLTRGRVNCTAYPDH